jgi:hypothetical protein
MARFVDLKGAVRPLLSASYRYAGRGSTAVNPWHNESGLVLDAAAAARLVVVRQQFSVGGKQPFTATAYGNGPMSAKTSVATNRPFVWLDDGRLGSSLATTAALARGRSCGRFWFTWPEDALPSDPGSPSGVLDGLTWPSRSMLLVRGDGGDSSAGIMICDGLRWPEFSEDAAYRDLELVPHTVFARLDGSGPYLPQRIHPDRPAWHQLAVMCADPEYPGTVPIRRTQSRAPFPRWRLGGLGAFQAAISGPVTASFPVPIDPSAVRHVLAEMSGVYRQLAGLNASLANAVSGLDDVRPPIVSPVGLRSEFEAILVDVASGVLASEEAVELVAAIGDSITSRAYSNLARIRPLAAARVAVRRTGRDAPELEAS